MTGQRDFQTDAERGAGQGGGDGLAAFQGLGIHARTLDLAQHGVHGHDAVKDALRRIVAVVAHLGDDVQVHAARKRALFARGDDDALYSLVRQRLIDQSVQIGKALLAHDVHRLADGVPGDDGNAVGVGVHGEIGHGIVPFKIVCSASASQDGALPCGFA